MKLDTGKRIMADAVIGTKDSVAQDLKRCKLSPPKINNIMERVETIIYWSGMIGRAIEKDAARKAMLDKEKEIAELKRVNKKLIRKIELSNKIEKARKNYEDDRADHTR